MSQRAFPLWLSSETHNGRVTRGATTATSVNRDGGSDQGSSVQTGEVGRFEINLENLEAVESVAKKKKKLGRGRERSVPCGTSWFVYTSKRKSPACSSMDATGG